MTISKVDSGEEEDRKRVNISAQKNWKEIRKNVW